MKIEKQREILELATRVDEMANYSQYLKELIDDRILVKLPFNVAKKIKDAIHMESISYAVEKALNLTGSIFNYNLAQLYKYEEELIRNKYSIRANFLNQRQILISLRESSGYNSKGEMI